MIKIIFAMYNPETDCVNVSLDGLIHISFDCQKCNATIHLNEPSDITYLTRLAREEPKLTSRDGGSQGYVEAMVEFNYYSLSLKSSFILFLRIFQYHMNIICKAIMLAAWRYDMHYKLWNLSLTP